MSKVVLLENCMMIANENARSRAYLDILLSKGLCFRSVLFIKIPTIAAQPSQPMKTLLFDNETLLEEKIKQLGINIQIIEAESLNSEVVWSALETFKEEYCVFAVAPGYILGKQFFSLNKRFIHVHPGKLPEYRGSTPMYYSLLKEGKLCATAIFLQQAIDTGEIISEKEFNLPKKKESIDLEYDPWMRANLLTEVLQNLNINQSLTIREQIDTDSETYYIIHPVLKHLAILKVSL